MSGTGVALLFCTSGPASGSLLDVRDPRGFVAAAIQKSGVRPSPAQRDDLIAEGLAILCDLAGRYEPHREGYTRPGKFSGYAASLLPRRMQDAWHQMNPTLTSRDEETGKRVREFLKHTTLDDESLPPLAATYGLVDSPEGYDTVDRAIEAMPTWDRACARRLVSLLDDGHGTDVIARDLGMGRTDVADLQSSLASAIAQVRTMEAA